MEISEILKASDDTRLRILNIKKVNFAYVILKSLELNQSNASKHLNKLKSVKIINATKKAQCYIIP